MHHAFLHILYFFAPLHDYHVKMPNFMFCEGRKQAMTKFSFSFMNLDMVDRNSIPEEFACIRVFRFSGSSAEVELGAFHHEIRLTATTVSKLLGCL